MYKIAVSDIIIPYQHTKSKIMVTIRVLGRKNEENLRIINGP